MASDNIKENIKNTHSWLRFLFIIIFLAFYGLAEAVFWFSVIVQVLFTLFTGTTNRNIKALTGRISVYIYAVLRYVSYQTEEKPFPFSPWPPYNGPEEKRVPAENGVKETDTNSSSDSLQDDVNDNGQEG